MTDIVELSPKIRLWVVKHPDLDEVWICSTREKCITLVEMNEQVWAKYGMDTELFTFHHSSVKDQTLQRTIKDGMPELFL